MIHASSHSQLLGQVCEHIAGEGLFEDTRAGKVTYFPGPRTLRLDNPRNRLALVPARRLNPWVTLAEFPWIMAGWNDVAWLKRYLPRAAEFSDDGGTTWRAGYGPRLKHWGSHPGSPSVGVDRNQIIEVLDLLSEKPNTRRAAMSLWDPAIDYGDYKDIPCTLSLVFWLGPVDNLNLHVTMRSNDVWWGMSGVNITNWTLLQELLANCLDVPVGRYFHTVTNLHLYERHWEQAKTLIEQPIPTYPEHNAPGPGTHSSDLRNFIGQAARALAFVEGVRSRTNLDNRLVPIEHFTEFLAKPPESWLVQWAYFMHLHSGLELIHTPPAWAHWLRPVKNPAWQLAVLLWLRRKGVNVEQIFYELSFQFESLEDIDDRWSEHMQPLKGSHVHGTPSP